VRQPPAKRPSRLVSLNFLKLNDFTWSLKTDLAQILSDHSARASYIIWISLLDRIICHYHDKGVTVEEHLLAFARDMGPVPSFINDLSTAVLWVLIGLFHPATENFFPGSFGSKGVHVIVHVLEAMFRTSTVPLDPIRPLDIKKFMNSFLIPYVATRRSLTIYLCIYYATSTARTFTHTNTLQASQGKPTSSVARGHTLPTDSALISAISECFFICT